MGTEDIRIQDGRLTVERASHKTNADIKLSDVEQVYFERSLDPSADAALVLTTKDGKDHLIRVANEDHVEVLGVVYDALAAARKSDNSETNAPPAGDGAPKSPKPSPRP